MRITHVGGPTALIELDGWRLPRATAPGCPPTRVEDWLAVHQPERSFS